MPSTVEVSTTTDAARFARSVQPVLDRYPVAANVMATVLGSVVDAVITPADPLWLLISRDGEPIGAGMHLPPYGLFLTPVPDGSAPDAAEAVAGVYATSGRPLDGVAGTLTEATAFARVWQRETGRGHRTAMAQRIYELLVVLPPSRPVSGSARLAVADDLPLLRRWLDAFQREIDPDGPRIEDDAELRDRIDRGLFMLWTDAGRPVSVAGFHQPSAGVSRVGPVYTPAEVRGRGYAAGATAAASQACFDGGATRCMLYTDLANPTSNGVYQRLGYTPIADAVHLRFEAPAG